jgi:hypothetical protein
LQTLLGNVPAATRAPKKADAVPRVLKKVKNFRQEIGALIGASVFPPETRGVVANLARLLACREETSDASVFKAPKNRLRY